MRLKIRDPIAVIGRDPELTLLVMTAIAHREARRKKFVGRVEAVKAALQLPASIWRRLTWRWLS